MDDQQGGTPPSSNTGTNRDFGNMLNQKFVTAKSHSPWKYMMVAKKNKRRKKSIEEY